MPVYHIPKIIQKFYPEYIWELPDSDKSIYLTFDDGPNPETTTFILDTLDKFDAAATFFCVGENVVKHPDLFQQMIDMKHAVANHSFNHIKHREHSDREYISNVLECKKYIHSELFRPPYGKISRLQAKMLRNLGFKIIMYSILTNDFNQKLSPETILYKSLNYTRAGSIIVFHDNKKAYKNMSKVFPKYIQYLKDKGFLFKTIPA